MPNPPLQATAKSGPRLSGNSFGLSVMGELIMVDKAGIPSPALVAGEDKGEGTEHLGCGGAGGLQSRPTTRRRHLNGWRLLLLAFLVASLGPGDTRAKRSPTLRLCTGAHE